MKKIFAQADLSGWLSPDEERLIYLYRDAPAQQRDEWLYRITRRRLAWMVTVSFDEARDVADSTYLHEELEQWLREICPWTHLGNFFCDEPQRSTLIHSAWGAAGRVLLGSCERDGERADQLINAAVALWDMVGNGPGLRAPMDLTRAGALAFLEEWRREALSFAFRAEEEKRGVEGTGCGADRREGGVKGEPEDVADLVMSSWPADWPGRQLVDLDNVGDPGDWLENHVVDPCIEVLIEGDISSDEPLAASLVEDYLAALEANSIEMPWIFCDTPDDAEVISDCREAIRLEFISLLQTWRANVRRKLGQP